MYLIGNSPFIPKKELLWDEITTITLEVSYK